MPDEWKGGIDLEKFGAHAARQERCVFTSLGRIWSADIVGYNVGKGKLLWGNGICIMDITLEQVATQINL